MKNVYRKAMGKEVLAYGFGGVGSNIPFILIMFYLMNFYTDHLGVNAAAVGGLFLAARFIDAITDPIMGMIADRTKSKRGKYRPWIIIGAPFLGILTVLLFTDPNLSHGGKVVYIYITYILYSIISTIVNIPYHSLTPVLTEDSDQRTTIATTKQILGIIGTMFVTVGAIPVVTALGNNTNAWQIFAIISGVLITLSFWICAFGARKHDKMEIHNAYINPNKSIKISIKDQLKLIYKNKALLLLMIAFGTDMIAFAAASAINIYYMKYNIGRVDLIPKIAFMGIVVSVVVSLLIPLLSKKFGKKALFLFGSTVLMILSGILYFTPFSAINQVVLVGILIAGFGPLTGVVGWAMLADCVEYGEWKTGNRGAGVVSSQLTFVNKFGMAIGGMIGAVLLGASGFVANISQTPETMEMIVRIKTWLPIAGYICSLIAMYFYPITKDFYKKMVEENEIRRVKDMDVYYENVEKKIN